MPPVQSIPPNIEEKSHKFPRLRRKSCKCLQITAVGFLLLVCIADHTTADPHWGNFFIPPTDSTSQKLQSILFENRTSDGIANLTNFQSDQRILQTTANRTFPSRFRNKETFDTTKPKIIVNLAPSFHKSLIPTIGTRAGKRIVGNVGWKNLTLISTRRPTAKVEIIRPATANRFKNKHARNFAHRPTLKPRPVISTNFTDSKTNTADEIETDSNSKISEPKVKNKINPTTEIYNFGDLEATSKRMKSFHSNNFGDKIMKSEVIKGRNKNDRLRKINNKKEDKSKSNSSEVKKGGQTNLSSREIAIASLLLNFEGEYNGTLGALINESIKLPSPIRRRKINDARKIDANNDREINANSNYTKLADRKIGNFKNYIVESNQRDYDENTKSKVAHSKGIETNASIDGKTKASGITGGETLSGSSRIIHHIAVPRFKPSRRLRPITKNIKPGKIR